MYADYWGLTDVPFRNTLDPRWFYESPAHEEALARLSYLIEQRRSCGLLVGTSGTGKSLVLEVLRGDLSRGAGEFARLDLCGLSATEFLWEIAAAWGLGPAVDAGPTAVWRRLHDHLQANRLTPLPLVLLLDHLDLAHAGCLEALERLLRLTATGDTGLTVVLACQNLPSGPVAARILELVELSVRLVPLDREQTEYYVETQLFKAGARSHLFDAAALDQLYRVTHGVPRELNRLCDLALLAAMVDQAPAVSAAAIAALFPELPAESASVPPTPARPGRVVARV